ncbi:MAG: hypothetical protein JRJ69_11385 [Deltaproteobacteria bacterium]|nr:hypothetical protein [Deltaproteobacteria bacterium]MBW1738126.1 hypothetical protein [Deltaproteobacteria bacterium]MBW1910132.1 hypothetical protein [Deltaproteobacteria bacterium]MBW2032972.1 hypothetical protein [Deltaproteobacteria bacterium]MBW2115423.1 hypothetical protein [Deltaproteobacteria bacterium]
MVFLKRVLFWASLIAICYGILGYHFIFFGRLPKILKKTKFTLSYTVFSIPKEEMLKSNKTILDIDALREAGIADLLVEMGRMTEKEKERLLEEYEEEDY